MSVRPHTEYLWQLPGRYPRSTAPIGRPRPARPPTVFELLDVSEVQRALEQAWVSSTVNDPNLAHEEGGWIYMDVTTGQVTVRQVPSGRRGSVQLGNPPTVPGSVVVASFHTHPNRDFPGPSTVQGGDLDLQRDRGVPGIIRAANGIHVYGVEARRGDWRTTSRIPGLPP